MSVSERDRSARDGRKKGDIGGGVGVGGWKMRAEAAHGKGKSEAVSALRLQMAERVAAVCRKGLNKNDVAAVEEEWRWRTRGGWG